MLPLGIERLTIKTAGGNLIDITDDPSSVVSPYWVTTDDICYLSENNIIVRNLPPEDVSNLLDKGIIKRNEMV